MSAPAIRFTGPDGDYNPLRSIRMGDVSDWVRTNSLSRDKLNNEGGPFQNIHYGDIHTKYPTMFSQCEHDIPYVTLGELRDPAENDYCKAGDLVIADASEDLADVGKTIEIITVDSNSLVAGLHTHLLRPNPNVFAHGYAGYMMRSPSIRAQIERVAQGTKVYGLSKKNIADITIPLPSLPEQRRIADALSAVDAKIDLLTRKGDNLARFKAGLMQQIFSQEVRFTREDGSPYPDWEEKELGELLTYQQPTPYLVKSSDYNDDAPTPVLTAGKTFILGYTFEKSGVYEALPVIIFDDFTTASRYVDFPFKAKSSAMKMLATRNSEDSCRVIYEAMTQIDYEISGHKRHWISEYQYLPVFLPSSEEQKRIDKVIENLDARIAFSDQQITTMQSFKKGLLQQMFV